MSDSPMYVYRGEALANYGFGDEHPFGMDRHEAFQTELAESGLGTAIQYVEPKPDLVEPVQQRFAIGNAFLDVFPHVLCLIEFRLLRQVADIDPRLWSGLAIKFCVEPGHNPQERRFARAVESEDADFCAREKT